MFPNYYCCARDSLVKACKAKGHLLRDVPMNEDFEALTSMFVMAWRAAVKTPAASLRQRQNKTNLQSIFEDHKRKKLQKKTRQLSVSLSNKRQRDRETPSNEFTQL